MKIWVVMDHLGNGAGLRGARLSYEEALKLCPELERKKTAEQTVLEKGTNVPKKVTVEVPMMELTHDVPHHKIWRDQDTAFELRVEELTVPEVSSGDSPD